MDGVLPFLEHRPVLGERVFVAPGAKVIGRVKLGDDVSIWHNAVLRGDINSIEIGARSNVQDNASIHLADSYGVKIGADVVIGHNAVVHACTIDDNCLIGMGAIVMDGAHVGTGSIVAAGALVPPGKVIPPNSMVAGVPCKVMRETSLEERDANKAMAAKYVRNKDNFLATPA